MNPPSSGMCTDPFCYIHAELLNLIYGINQDY